MDRADDAPGAASAGTGGGKADPGPTDVAGLSGVAGPFGPAGRSGSRANRPTGSVLPLVVGVTGHRDPSDPARLAEETRQRMQEIAQLWPEMPKVALSALADGADRIFARVALDLGWQLHVPLPMARDRYAEDFSAASRAEFDSLCAAAAQLFQVPPLLPEAAAERRELAYAAAGVYIARHCHVLFALWDGNPVMKAGGTTHVLACRLEGRIPAVGAMREVALPEPLALPFRSLDITECLTVVIPTARLSTPMPPDPPAGWVRGPALPLAGEALPRLAAMGGLETFARMAERGAELASRVPQADPAQLAALAAAADRIANERVPGMRRSWRRPMLMFSGALVASAVYGDLDGVPCKRCWLLAYFLCLAATAGLGWLSLRRERRRESPGWRSLAEALRVLEAWRLAGVGRPTTEWVVAQRGGGSGRPWVEAALRGLDRGYLPSDPPRTAFRDLGALRRGWIAGQIAYLERSLADQRRIEQRRSWGVMGFAAGLVVALIVLAAEFELLPFLCDPARKVLWFFSGLLSTLSGLWLLFLEIRALSAPGGRAAMLLQFHRHVAARIDALPPPEGRDAVQVGEIKELVFLLGCEALRETADWHAATERADQLSRELAQQG